jgi:WD40 repeat protein
MKEGEVGVKVLEFSKTGQWLAVGCANGTVNVYHMQTDMALLCSFQHGSDAITGLYWSNSSLLSIDLSQTSHQWSLAENPDIEIPLWPPLPSQIVCGARVLCVKQAQEGPYIAVGNEWGLLELRIPNKDLPIAYRFHANAITSLYWCSNDHQIVTISADDQSVVLWSVLQG